MTQTDEGKQLDHRQAELYLGHLNYMDRRRRDYDTTPLWRQGAFGL